MSTADFSSKAVKQNMTRSTGKLNLRTAEQERVRLTAAQQKQIQRLYIQPVHNTETGEELPINIILPQNLTKIGERCFDGASIKQITIPDTVTEIGDGAFLFCRQLESITCLAATPPALGTDALYTDTAGIPIKVPAASVAAYKAADGWKDYESYIVAM